MPKYAVTCIDRLDGFEYTLFVDAQSEVEAKMLAAKNHIAGEVRPVERYIEEAEMAVRARPLTEDPATVAPGASPTPMNDAVMVQLQQQNVMLYQQLQAMRLEQAQRHQQVHGFNILRVLFAVGLTLLILFVCAGFAVNLLSPR